ncbi:acyltransferase family protein [Flavitalea flava]
METVIRPEKNKKEGMKVYFKNLDGIRFIAAFLVLIHHSIFFKKGYSDSTIFVDNALEQMGRLGVSLFFILSGFLISYLLLVEKDSTGTVSYRNFYIRRILRIWPLYLGFGLFITFFSPLIARKLGMGSDTDFALMMQNLLFLLFFAVNFQLAFIGDNQGIFEVSWSVCIEEQFYVIWPLLLNTFRKRLPALLVVMFGVSIFIRIMLYAILPALMPHVRPDYFLSVNYEMIFDKLDLFGGGLFLALLYYHRDRFTVLFRRLFHPALQVIMTILAILFSLSVIKPDPFYLIFFHHYVCDILYGYVLLAAVSENSIYNLEYPLLKTLGKISYGIYLFHTSVCQIVLIFFKKAIGHPESRILYDIGYPLTNLVVTCTIAYLSYTFYESWFLRKKQKFAVVATRI